MAARTITMDELGAAVKEYASRHELTVSSNEKGFCLMPGDVIITLLDGKPSCSNAVILDSLIEILMDLAEEPTRAPQIEDRQYRQSTSTRKEKASLGALVKPVSQLSIQDIKEHFCKLATDQEAYTFLQTCLMAGANPWLSEAYLIKYDEKSAAKTVMGKYYFLKKAEKHPQYGGFSSGIIVQKPDGKIEERVGKFMLSDEKLLGGWCEVTRLDRKVPLKVTVSFSEYDKGNGQWRKMGPTMIEKVAIVQSHRDSFPSDLGGLYDASEIIESECVVVE